MKRFWFQVVVRDGRGLLIAVWRVPLFNAGPMPLGLCRFGEIEKNVLGARGALE